MSTVFVTSYNDIMKSLHFETRGEFSAGVMVLTIDRDPPEFEQSGDSCGLCSNDVLSCHLRQSVIATSLSSDKQWSVKQTGLSVANYKRTIIITISTTRPAMYTQNTRVNADSISDSGARVKRLLRSMAL